MKGEMIESKYLEGLLEGIPIGLVDGTSSEKDLLKMVDLPMENFAHDDDSHAEWDCNETRDLGPIPTDAYVGCRPGGNAVWDTLAEPRPKLIPLNSLVPRPEPILSDSSVGLPLVLGEEVVKHAIGCAVLDTPLEVKPNLVPLNGLIINPGPVPLNGSMGLPPAVEDEVARHTLVLETEPIPSDASLGLPCVVKEQSIGSADSDTLLESKPKPIPPKALIPKSRTITVDDTIGSTLIVEGKVAENMVDSAPSVTLPKPKPEIPAEGNTEVLESGSSRAHSPVSVLDISSCNSAGKRLVSIKFRGAQLRKRSKRPRPKQVKTPWFHISLISSAAAAKKSCKVRNTEKKKISESLARSSIKDSDQHTTEKMLFAFPASWKDQTPARGSVGTKKCSHCEVTKTPQWREGPNGPKTLCNACGVRYRSGRLFPEYRPAASPTFIPFLHSNSHRKVIEMRKQAMQETSVANYPHKIVANPVIDSPMSPDSPLIENIPMMGHPFELIY